jgi:AAA domain
MKIEALRLAAFRRFSGPVAIENFADGINLLAGPNEMGKSTFFHALEAAFTLRHKVTGTVLDGMRPFSGGEPLVEADFSSNGQRWRIRKQFGRGNAAILTDLDAGRIVSRNAEAEEKLAGLIGRAGELPGPIGLVWVRQQRTLHAPDPDIDPLTGKDKPRGERSALQEAIGREVQSAAGGEVFERVKQLTAAALDVSLTPTRNAPRKNGPLELSRRRRDETRATLELAQRAAVAAEQRLQAIAAAAQDLSALTLPDGVQARNEDLAGLEDNLAQEVKRRTSFDLAREALKTCVSEVESARQSLAVERTRGERLVLLEKQRASVEMLEGAIAKLAQAVNEDAATPARVDRLARLERVLDIANAELTSDAPNVAIDVLPGGLGRVRVDGAAIDERLHRDVPEQLDITIEGIARIKVTSAGAARAAAARVRRDEAAKHLAEILSAIGVATVQDARLRAEARQQSVAELDRTQAQLSGVAPGGLASVAAGMSQLQATGPQNTATLEAELRTRETAAHVADERYNALKAAVLSDEAFRSLSQQLDTARRAEADMARNISRLTMQIENLKSEQAGADEDGRAGQVPALLGELEKHDAEVARLESEGMSLLLLARTLDSIEENARDAFFEPVTRRLQPYLNDVFGAADLGFKDAFAIGALTRGGQREEFGVLSDGTREQLSVLVRLGFAEILAARGSAVPLVLDDPLVYSDDERLEKVFRVLETAAQQLQIIVLTCRAAAFQKLSGHRVSVTAWQPES